jgi:NAD(P)-dependent dehydrogenase (short-subunit alcohol dehydrogenase family)
MMFKDGLFRGKRILITGGGSGLGKGMAERFLVLGAEVIICGRRRSVCAAAAAELMAKHGGSVTAYGVDIRDAAAVDAMVADIVRSGPLTDLVNNAAGNFISRTEDLSPRGFDAIANIVMHGTFYVTHAVGRRWIAAGRGGNVLSIVVTWIDNGGPFVVPSAMSKAAVHAMTMSLATEWGRYGIRLNAIAPGEIPTEGMSKRLNPDEVPGARTARLNPWGGPGVSRSCKIWRRFCCLMAARGSRARPSPWTAASIWRPAATFTTCGTGPTPNGRRRERPSRRRTRRTAPSAAHRTSPESLKPPAARGIERNQEPRGGVRSVSSTASTRRQAIKAARAANQTW